MNCRIAEECMVSSSFQHRMHQVNSSRLQLDQEMRTGNSVGGLIRLGLLRGTNGSNAVEFQADQDEIGLQSSDMKGGKTLLMDLIRQFSLWLQVDEIETTYG